MEKETPGNEYFSEIINALGAADALGDMNTMTKDFKKIKLKTFTNRGFNLTPVEFKDAVPFAVERMYYFDSLKEKEKTGAHCHKIEEEVFIQAKGAVTAIIDRGQGIEEILLKTGDAIYCPNYVWHGFKDASADALIIALSSTNYNPDRSDYIEDYGLFKKMRAERDL